MAQDTGNNSVQYVDLEKISRRARELAQLSLRQLRSRFNDTLREHTKGELIEMALINEFGA